MNRISMFQKTVWNFYHNNKREMPWRETTDPYKILVSEVMLQQTQVPRVLQKYEEWMQELPTFKSLANAPLSQILKLWSGLGYNRRAMFLQKTAQMIVKEHNGKLPDDPKILETFPGIGKNTAGSLIAFSYNKPVVFIETNIRRVFIHHFFTDVIPAQAGTQKTYGSPIRSRMTRVHQGKIPDNDLLPLVEQTLDSKNPREWYYALMDYGAFLAKSVPNPNRKSKHYAKQSPLKGSLREARGRILKSLSQTPAISQTELEKQVGVELERFQKALTALKNEHFIKIADGIVEIASSLA